MQVNIPYMDPRGIVKVVVVLIFSMFIPTWGNDPIWLAHIFHKGLFNHQLESVMGIYGDGSHLRGRGWA